jgi:hypothetical protein
MDFSTRRAYASFALSLLWVSVIIAWGQFIEVAADVLVIDFLNINPHRSQTHAASLPFIFAPFDFIISGVGTLIVFGAAQFVQAVLTGALVKSYGRFGLLVAVLGIAPTAVITWYCYDYLVPSDFNLGINVGEDWVPYQHGITFPRYLAACGLQGCVVLFSLWRLNLEVTGHPSAKKYVLLLAIGVASIVGGLNGWKHGSWNACFTHFEERGLGICPRSSMLPW